MRSCDVTIFCIIHVITYINPELLYFNDIVVRFGTHFNYTRNRENLLVPIPKVEIIRLN